MFIQLKKTYFGKQPGERVDVEEPNAKTLIEQGIAEVVQGDHLGALIEKQIGGMLEGLTRGLNETITKTLEQLDPLPQERRPRHLRRVRRRRSEKELRRLAAQRRHRRLEERQAGHRSPGPARKRVRLHVQRLAEGRPGRIVRRHRRFPYLDITTVQSAGVSPFFGGVQAYWTAEAQTRTETEPQFKMMELKANELSGYSVSSNILLQDAAFGLEKFLMVLFGQAVAWFEEYAFLRGNGVGKPMGVQNANAALKVNRNTASHFYFPDVAGMLASLLPSSYGKAVWYISPTVVSDLLQLKDGANRAIFISIDQGVTKPPVWKLLNMPVVITEKVPALGTTGDVSLIDASLYVIGDRMQLEIAASEHVNFLKNQMTWRFVQRVDGQPWMDKAVTLQDASTQVSPFVILN